MAADYKPSVKLLSALDGLLEQSCYRPKHPLESGSASSTWGDDRLLHHPEMEPLLRRVRSRAAAYWDALGYESGRHMVVTRCWANFHERGGSTVEHNHGGVHINGVYYVSAPQNSGALLIRNPLEYHLSSAPFGAPYGDRLWHRLEVATGDLVLMPGWLKHMTEVSRSDERRTVVTFNMFGVPDE